MGNIKGYPSSEKLDNTSQEYASVQPTGQKTHGLETKATISYTEAATDTAEAGSTTQVINATAHVATVGDLISWTAGALIGQEYAVVSTTTNTITVGVLMTVAPGLDNFSILRPKTLQVTAAGAITNGPIKFLRDGADQVVTEDTGTPANNRPLPVKITGLDGDVSINAANLNLEVQLDHNSANPDSVQIGDGTETLAINADGSIPVTDNGGSLTTDTPQLAATLGQKASAGSAAVVLASDQSVIPISDNAGSLTVDSPQLPATLGQKAMAASLAVVIASDQSVVSIDDNAGSITTDTPQLPTTIGQKAAAASTSVVLASDQATLPTDQQGRSSVDLIRHDYSGGTVTTAAYTELIAATSGAIQVAHIFDSSGEIMILAFGAVASEVDQFYIEPGGPGPVEITIPAATRLSVKALSANATAGDLVINGMA